MEKIKEVVKELDTLFNVREPLIMLGNSFEENKFELFAYFLKKGLGESDAEKEAEKWATIAEFVEELFKSEN